MQYGREEAQQVYGEAVIPILKSVEALTIELAEDFATSFYATLLEWHHGSEILLALSAEEMESLRKRQAQYLIMLLSPSLTQDAHASAARHVGRVHALVGLDVLWLVQTYGMYLVRIREMLAAAIAREDLRGKFMDIASQRIFFDMEFQFSVYGQIDRRIDASQASVDRAISRAGNLTDLVRTVMAVTGELDGDVCMIFGRADAEGEVQVEATFGKDAEVYSHGMDLGTIPRMSIHDRLQTGQGPGGRAWRSGQIKISNSWSIPDESNPWLIPGKELGFRSSAAVPVLNEMGQSIAILSLYSRWPGYFSAPRLNGFLSHVQRALGYGVQRWKDAMVISLQEQKVYRDLLDEHQVEMLYQPIIDLRSGKLDRLEALARLRGRDGKLFSPARFLPAFGEEELLQLFQLGLKQICADAKTFESAGLIAQFAINFPAAGVSDERYEKELFETLEVGGLSPSRLQLEMLETEDRCAQKEQGLAFLRRLNERGIRLAQDDLGSGHSSLLRMEQYSFDEVKIDQGLVRSALHKPLKALEFILHLTRLAHGFDTVVVVEGLENLGMIEAAAILGADFGQGYGIARPMPGSEVVRWTENYKYPADPLNPKTALGALAAYVLLDMEMSVMSKSWDAQKSQPVANGVIERFLAHQELHQSPLEKAFLARNGSRTKEALRIDRQRDPVVELLTERWQSELMPKQ